MACRVDRLIFVLFKVSLDDGRVKTFRSILSNKRGFQSVNRKFFLFKPVSGYWMRSVIIRYSRDDGSLARFIRSPFLNHHSDVRQKFIYLRESTKTRLLQLAGGERAADSFHRKSRIFRVYIRFKGIRAIWMFIMGNIVHLCCERRGMDFPPVIKRFRSTDVVFAAAEVWAGNEFNHFISNVVRFDEETFPIALSLPITRKLG